jgi:tetratricopeptide (TPR) repeat protein
MKNKLLLIVILLISLSASGQNRKMDSLYHLLRTATTDTGKNGKVRILSYIAQEYQQSSPDSSLYYSEKAYKISQKIKYTDGLSRSATLIGTVYLEAGNYAKAFEYYIQTLKIEEKNNDPENLAVAIMSIANIYHKEGNYIKAFPYAMRADSIINRNNISNLKLYSLLNLGDLFEKTGKLDLALDYTSKANLLAVKEDNKIFIGLTLNNLGNIYAKKGAVDLAIENYKKGIPYLEAFNIESFIVESYLGLAKLYALIHQSDSSLLYATRSYEITKKNGFLAQQLDACLFLSDYYKSKDDIHKAYDYKDEVLTLKDSIFSKERIAKSQLLSMEEDLRQKEMAEKKIQESEDRKVELQYLAIGLLLPILFFITVYLSNRKIKPRYVEFLGVVSLLLTFEYIMLLLHPAIVSFSNHLPVYELLCFAAIAAILTPLHHRIENWLVKILTKKERLSLLNIRIQ